VTSWPSPSGAALLNVQSSFTFPNDHHGRTAMTICPSPGNCTRHALDMEDQELRRLNKGRPDQSTNSLRALLGHNFPLQDRMTAPSPFDHLRSCFTYKVVRLGVMQSVRMAKGYFEVARSEWGMPIARYICEEVRVSLMRAVYNAEGEQ